MFHRGAAAKGQNFLSPFYYFVACYYVDVPAGGGFYSMVAGKVAKGGQDEAVVV